MDDELPAQTNLAVLTQTQKEWLLARIAEARRGFVRAHRARVARTHFQRALAWVFDIFSFGLSAEDEYAPPVSYGASFSGIVGYVARRRIDAEAEEVAEEEEPRY